MASHSACSRSEWARPGLGLGPGMMPTRSESARPRRRRPRRPGTDSYPSPCQSDRDGSVIMTPGLAMAASRARQCDGPAGGPCDAPATLSHGCHVGAAAAAAAGPKTC